MFKSFRVIMEIVNFVLKQAGLGCGNTRDPWPFIQKLRNKGAVQFSLYNNKLPAVFSLASIYFCPGSKGVRND